ncbi:exosome complex exonuclease RRP42-like [Strongylocentrotus purpuratus]|uniref:Ribosomal RNA-processing protein 42 n=1 Tax=Strongylocentrotus purpuratus TaxID=7668 RepID=A0A7M7N616_STRPU|nr:exosome complex exonuclease RRP42-like [Strongylocentrotus purpuratus]
MASIQLGEGEKTFIIHGICKDDLRSDGRTCLSYRNFELECGVVSNTSGSARLKLSNTQVLVGVKAEMGPPNPLNPSRGGIEFFVDFSANASPKFAGRGGDELAAEISNMLGLVYKNKKMLDYKSLCVIAGQCVWTLYADIVVLECGGNLLDAIALAVKAALYNTRIPLVTVHKDMDGTEDIDVSSNPHDFVTLDTKNLPVLVTVTTVGSGHIVDATLEEEACSMACIVAAVNKEGAIDGMVKKGSGSLTIDSIYKMLTSAKQIGKDLNKSLDDFLSKKGSDMSSKGFLT